MGWGKLFQQKVSFWLHIYIVKNKMYESEKEGKNKEGCKEVNKGV